MATKNAVNLNDAGIISYNGTGTFSALGNPLTVANGGTGVSSNTAYAVLTGGTTSTNPIQNIASVGTSSHVLTSNGAAALPTFQANSGYTIEVQTTAGSPADATSYFLYRSLLVSGFTLSNPRSQFIIPTNSTIVACYASFSVGGTLGSTQTSILYVRVNDTTDNSVITGINLSTALSHYSNTGLSISLSAGDYIAFKWITPTWSPNPTTVSVAATLYLI